MRHCRIIVVVFIMLLTLLVFGCGRPTGEQTDVPETAEATASELDDPGRSRPADQVTALTVPVEALIVRARSVEQNVPLTGVANPILAVDLIAEVSGKVEKVYRTLGDYVTPDDTLARIDDLIPLSNYRRAQAQLISVENNLRIAELNYRSDEDLFETGDISQLEIETSKLALKTAEANVLAARADLRLMEKTYSDTRITSPITGRISRKYVDLGTMVMPNAPVFRVVDLSTLKVALGVPQSMISRVRVGGPAVVWFSALGSKEYQGVVRFVSPQADEGTGTFLVEVHVKNTSGIEIKGGMTARVELVLKQFGEQLVVPDYAIVTKNGSNHVYKIEDGIANLTEIGVAATFGSQVVVDWGLAEGDTVVVVGMKNLGVDTKVYLETIQE